MFYTKDLTREECRDFLSKSNFGRLACSKDDQPYLVPLNLVFDGEHLYAFSTVGRKIHWMRENPKVCVEIEAITSSDDWTTVIIEGVYQELSANDDLKTERDYARELLSNRPKWWKPAYTSGSRRTSLEEIPVYFRILPMVITGQRVFTEEIESTVVSRGDAKRQKTKTLGLW